MDKRFKYLVSKFLDNELDATEKKELDKFLKDPAYMSYLKKEEKAEKVIRIGLRNMLKREALLDQLDKEMDEIPEEIKEDVRLYGGKADKATRAAVKRMHRNMIRRRRISFVFKYVLPAASLLVGLYFFWTDYLQPLPQSLFRAQYKPYEFAVISPATLSDERINSAMSMYKSGNYASGARLCSQIIASGTKEGDIHFLYGLNLMALDSIQRAIKEFDAQIKSPALKDTDRHLPVYWYKALCQLKLGRPDSALLTLMEGYYRKFKEKI